MTPAELTVLGLVVEQPRHGYDLEQVIEQRGIRQWTDIGFSSIYYLLTKLEKRGLLGADAAGGGAKSRRVFRATGEGRRAARENAHSFIAEGRMAAQPLLVGVANLPLLSELEYHEALSSRLTEIEARIASVLDAQHSQAPLPHAAREVFSYSLGLLEAERSWLVARVQVRDE